MKPKQHKRKLPFRNRQTLLKSIGAQSDAVRKLETAADCSLGFAFRNLQTNRDIFAMLNHVRWLSGAMLNGKPALSPKQIDLQLAVLGIAFLAKLADGDHKFFSRLAASLQYGRKPSPHKLSADILRFGLNENCGTTSQPCNPRKLLAYLQNRKHTFTINHDSDIPGKLRKTCKKIGFVLTAAKRGRPRNNSHR